MPLKPTSSFLKAAGLLLLFTLVPASLYVMYNRTGGPASQNELLFQKNLRYAFMNGRDIVDVAPLTPWPWVKMCAVTYGLTEDELTKVIGFAYKDYAQLHWLPRPETWTILFIDSAREASWGEAIPVTPIRIPRQGLADLALPDGVKGMCVSRASGRLTVTRNAEAPVGTSPVTARVVEIEPP